MPEGNFFHYDQAAVDHLARKDKKLAAAMQAIGPVRREVMPDLFQALMHAITGQQISMAAQRTVWGRLCCLLGEVTPLFDRETYCGMVERAKRHIREGDIFQIVLSNRPGPP